MKNGKLIICYMTDIDKRLENSKNILRYLEKDNITKNTNNGFITQDAVYIFINLNKRKQDNVSKIHADQVIIDFRKRMMDMSEQILKNSCVPKQYQIIDDRIIGTSDT